MDSVITAVITLAVSAAAGAFWAFQGYNKSNEPFDQRKFVSGIITGIVAGITLALTQVAGVINAADATQQLLALVGLFLAVGGVDTLRTSVTGAITKPDEPAPTS